jgi:hypothetical protein
VDKTLNTKENLKHNLAFALVHAQIIWISTHMI